MKANQKYFFLLTFFLLVFGPLFAGGQFALHAKATSTTLSFHNPENLVSQNDYNELNTSLVNNTYQSIVIAEEVSEEEVETSKTNAKAKGTQVFYAAFLHTEYSKERSCFHTKTFTSSYPIYLIYQVFRL